MSNSCKVLNFTRGANKGNATDVFWTSIRQRVIVLARLCEEINEYRWTPDGLRAQVNRVITAVNNIDLANFRLRRQLYNPGVDNEILSEVDRVLVALAAHDWHGVSDDLLATMVDSAQVIKESAEARRLSRQETITGTNGG